MASDLSARLRDAYVDTKHGPSFRLSLDPIDLLAAADLLDKQAAEIARLKDALRRALPFVHDTGLAKLNYSSREQVFIDGTELLKGNPHECRG